MATINLNKPMFDFEGKPILPQGGTFVMLKKKTTVSIYASEDGNTTKEVEITHGMTEGKPLTYRTFIFEALQAARENESVDVERRMKLMMKLTADTPDLSSEDRGDIIKCVKALKDPWKYLKVDQLFESVVEPEEEKPKKKKGKK